MQKLLLISAYCLCLCSCVLGIPTSITVKNCGRSMVPFDVQWDSPDRIVGGDHAKPRQFPWIISFFQDGRPICGGAVLNDRWIVTAAHCPDSPNQTNRYLIYAGLHKLSESWRSFVQERHVEKIVMHKDYNPGTQQHDIALVKLSEPLDLAGSDGHVNGICLPETNEDGKGKAIVSGWGYQWENGEGSDTLKAVYLRFVDRDYCHTKYSAVYTGYKITEEQLCAGGVEGEGDCQGDSGGPLIQADEEGKAVLLGVVSSGHGCGAKGWPGIYTRIYTHISWMRRVMAKY